MRITHNWFEWHGMCNTNTHRHLFLNTNGLMVNKRCPLSCPRWVVWQTLYVCAQPVCRYQHVPTRMNSRHVSPPTLSPDCHVTQSQPNLRYTIDTELKWCWRSPYSALSSNTTPKVSDSVLGNITNTQVECHTQSVCDTTMYLFQASKVGSKSRSWGTKLEKCWCLHSTHW